MLEITKDFEFEAAHSLPHLPPTHKCSRPHGHSYKVRICCQGTKDERLGWVIDYADISEVVRPVIDSLDHTDIDPIFKGAPSTAENLAIWLFDNLKPVLPSLVAVEVKETASSNVIYRP